MPNTFITKIGRTKATFTGVNGVSWRGIFIPVGTYRDEMLAAQLGRAHRDLLNMPYTDDSRKQLMSYAESQISTRLVNLVSANLDFLNDYLAMWQQVAGSPTPPFTTPEDHNDAVMEDSDTVKHRTFRQKFLLRMAREFWDGADVGFAGGITATTASGSAVITVPTNEGLVVGQKISGTGIPAGARIVGIPNAPHSVLSDVANDMALYSPYGTKVILSHQATADATITATLSGSNWIGAVWMDEEDATTTGTFTLLR